MEEVYEYDKKVQVKKYSQTDSVWGGGKRHTFVFKIVGWFSISSLFLWAPSVFQLASESRVCTTVMVEVNRMVM